MLKRSEEEVEQFTSSIARLKKEAHYCRVCHTISDTELCPICSSTSRDKSLVCVVENVRDVLTIENTGQYNGLYHVLGGIISPIDVASGEVTEVILALPTTMEGDTTNFYIYRRLEPSGVKVTQLARGVAVGNELEYTDEVTLGRSIINRTPYKS